MKKHEERISTQRQLVLAELKKKGRRGVTSWDLIEKYHITRASAYIWQLRHKYGLDIVSQREVSDSGAWYVRYILNEED